MFLSASLAAIAGCAAPVGESSDIGLDDAEDAVGAEDNAGAEDVAEASQAVCAAGNLDCADWGCWEPIPVIEDACGVPATAYYDGCTYAAYPTCGSQQIYMTSYCGNNWATPYAVADAYSPYSPSLAVYDNDLYLGYAAVGGAAYINRFNGYRWGGAVAVGVHTSFAPGLAAYNNRLHMVYGGWDNEIYSTAWDGRGWNGGVGWGVRSNVAPGLGVYNNSLYAAYPDRRGRLAVGSWDGYGFAGRGYIPGYGGYGGHGGHGGYGYAPSLAAYNGYLNFFYPARRGGGFGWTAWNGAGWAGNVVIPGDLGAYSPWLGYYGQRAALFGLGADRRAYWARHAGW